MIYIFYEYIKYLFISKRRYGIHSPFVYDFGDKCVRKKIPKDILSTFNRLKSQLFDDKTEIMVEDLGAGSKKLNYTRPVYKIAKISGTNDKFGKLLYRIVNHYPIENVLELGTSLGLGTFMLAAGKKEVKVTTVEGCKNTFLTAQKYFPTSEKNKVRFVHQSFVEFLKTVKIDQPYDLVFIDGDHKSHSLFEQLQLLEPLIHDETIIILDDIRWSKDMLSAWKNLEKNENYHLSLDVFRMGIIAKRHHQQKENFMIRY